jgi:hypothetical protein
MIAAQHVSFLFSLIKKETKKSRTHDVRPVCPGAMFNSITLVASAVDFYSLGVRVSDSLKNKPMEKSHITIAGTK